MSRVGDLAINVDIHGLLIKRESILRFPKSFLVIVSTERTA